MEWKSPITHIGNTKESLESRMKQNTEYQDMKMKWSRHNPINNRLKEH